MIIDIDTLLMNRAVREMVNACNEIDKAVDAIQSVKQHNDWQCKERTRINELNDQSKKDVMKLRDNTYSYANALKDVANDFDQEESSIISIFQDLTSVISDALNIVAQPILPPHLTEEIGSDFYTPIFPKVKWLLPKQLYQIAAIKFPTDLS